MVLCVGAFPVPIPYKTDQIEVTRLWLQSTSCGYEKRAPAGDTGLERGMGLLWSLFTCHIKMNQVGVVNIEDAADIVALLCDRAEKGGTIPPSCVRQ